MSYIQYHLVALLLAGGMHIFTYAGNSFAHTQRIIGITADTKDHYLSSFNKKRENMCSITTTTTVVVSFPPPPPMFSLAEPPAAMITHHQRKSSWNRLHVILYFVNINVQSVASLFYGSTLFNTACVCGGGGHVLYAMVWYWFGRNAPLF